MQSSRDRLRALCLAVVFVVTTPALFGQSSGPELTKSFGPSTIGPGSISTARFVISNQTNFNVRGVGFVDNLPSGMTVAPVPRPTTTCGEGSFVNAIGGSSTISLSGGNVPVGRSCVVTVNVTAANPGTYENITENLFWDQGVGSSARATLTVTSDLPSFTKAFIPATTPFLRRVTLEFRIDNSASSIDALNLTFTDPLPKGLTVASPSNASSTCNGGVLTAPAGATSISYAPAFFGDASVGAGQTCSIRVDLIAGAAGSLGNLSSELSSTTAVSGTPRSSGRAGAVLTVTSDNLIFAKSFTNDPIPAGHGVILEYVVQSRLRSDSATQLNFTDDLGAALSGLAATNLPQSDVCGPGSVLSGSSVVTLTGGSVEAGAECRFQVQLAVPSNASDGGYLSETSLLEAQVAGRALTAAPASDTLFISSVPLLTKTFTTNPVTAGSPATIEFSITNSSSSFPATEIAFQDVLDDVYLSALSLPPDGFCGPDSTVEFIPAVNSNPPRLSISGASLAPSATCTFDSSLLISEFAGNGPHPNVTTAITAVVDGKTLTGSPARDDLVIIAGPRLTKRFLPSTVKPGGATTLRFTLSFGIAAPGDATSISFADDLSSMFSGLTATNLPLSDVCGTGSALSGTTTISLSGASLTPGESCTFEVSVAVPPNAPIGEHENVTSKVESSIAGETILSPAALTDLLVSGLSFSKSFTNDPVPPGGTATLEYSIANTTPAATATQIRFVDDFDSALTGLAATGLPLTDVCGAGSSIDSTNGGRTVFLSGGSLSAGQSCTFSLQLLVPSTSAPNPYSSSTTGFAASFDGGPLLSLTDATDELIVVSDFLDLRKEFLDDPAGPGGTVTLEFLVTNLASQSATSIAFEDPLSPVLPGLVAIGLPRAACGGTLSGSSTISFSGGTLTGGDSCAFTVELQVPASAQFGGVNVTTAPTALVNGNTVTGAPATDTLTIASLDFSKSFDEPEVSPGQTVGLTFSILNVSSSSSIESISFSDNLDAMISGAIAVGLPQMGVCGTDSRLAGSSLLVLSGAGIPAGGSCTFTVDVQIPSSALPGTYTNTTSALRIGGIPSRSIATATLDVIENPDSDGDGVFDSEDRCPGTQIPEGVPTEELKPNHYALVDEDLIFDTVLRGNNQGETFTTTDTAGCSCEQIIENLELGQGQRKFGCPVGIMFEWIESLD